MTVEEYLRLEVTADVRHEFRDGVAVAMSGGTYTHSLIITNLVGELRSRLKGKGCTALESNMRVRIPRRAKYCYPDVPVVSGSPEFDPAAPPETTILNPRLIVEVLSDSTEAFDRGAKFTDYREIESLREYVLVSQHAAQVEVYLRQDDGTWRFQPSAGLGATARLQSIGVDLPLDEIYAGVTFPPPAPEPGGRTE